MKKKKEISKRTKDTHEKRTMCGWLYSFYVFLFSTRISCVYELVSGVLLFFVYNLKLLLLADILFVVLFPLFCRWVVLVGRNDTQHTMSERTNVLFSLYGWISYRLFYYRHDVYAFYVYYIVQYIVCYCVAV